MPRLIVDDPRDALGRKVLRAELSADRDMVLIDLPKRYAASGASKFTQPEADRALDAEGCRYLLAFLTENLPKMRSGE